MEREDGIRAHLRQLPPGGGKHSEIVVRLRDVRVELPDVGVCIVRERSKEIDVQNRRGAGDGCCGDADEQCGGKRPQGEGMRVLGSVTRPRCAGERGSILWGRRRGRSRGRRTARLWNERQREAEVRRCGWERERKISLGEDGIGRGRDVYEQRRRLGGRRRRRGDPRHGFGR